MTREICSMQREPRVIPVKSFKISSYVPHSEVTEDGIIFSAASEHGAPGLILYKKAEKEPFCELPFPDKPSIGNIYSMKVSGIPASDLEYNFRVAGKIVTDPSAQLVEGLGSFGSSGERAEHQVRASFASPDFDWRDDRPIKRPYSESFFYELHVRGFTRSHTSGVKKKGTFAGISEKTGYLKELGVTAVVLLPCYEHDETAGRSRLGWMPEGLRELVNGESLPESALSSDTHKDQVRNSASGNESAEETPSGISAAPRPGGHGTGHLNYWGFGQGWFFAPKRSYCSSSEPENEFRYMVRSLHQSGIEVIMEMSFPDETDPAFMQACLVWWRQFYHVDGFMLMGDQESINAAVRCPALSDVKLISDYFDTSKIYRGGRKPAFRNLSEYNTGFRNDARRFLKGDSDSLQAFVTRSRKNPKDAGVINSITGHDGFTLCDLVSYNDKHNEANGENNRDGAPNEFSWNCGIEGPSRKRVISRLRMKQMKNALAMVMLSQGTPMITAGDEMLNTQSGNSNAYCIDSELTWVRWSSSKDAVELTDYLIKLSRFRTEHPLLHQTAELTGSSMGGFFPDFSYHGSNAWFASFDRQDRSVGIMYCRQEPDSDVSQPYLYVAYNFHWEERDLALPYLPHGHEWHVAVDTSRDRFSDAVSSNADDDSGAPADGPVEKYVNVPGRAIIILVG